MRAGEVDLGTNRYNPRRIDFLMRHVVVPLDVIEVHRRRDAGLLIKVAEISVKVRIIEDPTHVALEVPVINRIEPHERAEHPPVRFDRTSAK